MDSNQLTENYKTGLFESNEGEIFIACDFCPPHTIWINISTELWTAKYQGQIRKLDWNKIDLSKKIKMAIRSLVIERLKTRSPHYLSKIECSLKNLSKELYQLNKNDEEELSDIDIGDWLSIWHKLTASDRSVIRSLYKELAIKEQAGAKLLIASEMETWKARNETRPLRNVLGWDPDTGAFTSAEWEVLSAALNKEIEHESDLDSGIRIFCRILSETLKRPSQILGMKSDALWHIPPPKKGAPSEYFLRIPKAKHQAGQEPGIWQITEQLGRSIIAFSERKEIKKYQNQIDRLIIMIPIKGICPDWVMHGEMNVATAKNHIQDWAWRKKLISPRTKKPINLTPYRFRHTGGTTLALQGVPRELIQEILEQDSPYSADSYIKAVGSDLMPVLERSTDRGIGDVFMALNRSYFFKGSISDDVGIQPIIIPTVSADEAPAVVGSCGNGDICKKHPLWGCYNGCPHFLAWREADHTKALNYIENQLDKWRQSEGKKERSKLEKDFDRIGAAIKSVIYLIAEEGNEK